MSESRTSSLGALTAEVAAGRSASVYLISGDRVLAEPAAARLGEELARLTGCQVEIHRRPADLGVLLADLKTYSLFAPAKVLVAIDTAVLADAAAGAELIDEALEDFRPDELEGEKPSEPQRRAASRLLQTLRLFQIDSQRGSAEEAIAALPDSALQGGAARGGRQRRRGRRQIAEARDKLAALLEVARGAGLQGWAESDLAGLAEIAERGLPAGHALVLAESVVAKDHPLVQALAARGLHAHVGQVTAARDGGWQGIDLIVQHLQQETGVLMSTAAAEELGRRTITRKPGSWSTAVEVDTDSTARFAAEYRKLATLSPDQEIDLAMVEDVVEDRGEEDTWKILDAIGAGKVSEALQRIGRLLESAEDVTAARLSFFSLLSDFGRHLVALSELIEFFGVSRKQLSYGGFKTQVAPQLQADLPQGGKNPLSKLHPYRLYRAYSVACRIPAGELADLPARVLETERLLKGDSRDPDAALSALVCELAIAARAGS